MTPEPRDVPDADPFVRPRCRAPYSVIILNEDGTGDYYISGNGVIHVFQKRGCKAPPCSELIGTKHF